MIIAFSLDELIDWLEYAAKLAEGDPSAECREIAQMAAETIATVISIGD